MIGSLRFSRQIKAVLLACTGAVAVCGTAHAQDAAPAPIDGRKVLELLVAKGVIAQADADAVAAAAAADAVPAGGVQGNVQTVPYIPEPVLQQVREQVKAELAGQAQAEGWARPGETPEWTRRITVSGDVRIRGEGVFFGEGNSPDVPNFAAINAGAPFNINRASIGGQLNPAFLNTVEDRNRARIRARLGVTAALTGWAQAQVVIGTGNDTSPVSPNQTLGGGNGDFSKYSVWLDAANIRLRPLGAAGPELVFGRAANPFWTTDVLFDEDLNFDGASIAARGHVLGGLSAFGTIGAFPVFNTDLNFGSRDAGAFRSRDRWLLAGQLGVEATLAKGMKLSVAGGLFEFTGARGVRSAPCAYAQDVCDTDLTRPLFQQYGNSLFPIRNNLPDPNPATGPGLSPDPQYFGLASAFRVLSAHAALEIAATESLPVRIEGEYLRNLKFDRSDVLAVQSNVVGPYDPSGTAWHAMVRVGEARPESWGKWTLFGGYKHIGSDATIDAFTDSDFHLGGTNARGYYLGGAFGLGGRTTLGVRYLSADEITGQPYAVDVLQLDLSARF